MFRLAPPLARRGLRHARHSEERLALSESPTASAITLTPPCKKRGCREPRRWPGAALPQVVPTRQCKPGVPTDNRRIEKPRTLRTVQSACFLFPEPSIWAASLRPCPRDCARCVWVCFVRALLVVCVWVLVFAFEGQEKVGRQARSYLVLSSLLQNLEIQDSS